MRCVRRAVKQSTFFRSASLRRQTSDAGRLTHLALALLLVVMASVGCVSGDGSTGGPLAPGTAEDSPAVTGVETRASAQSDEPATREQAVAIDRTAAAVAAADPLQGRSRGEAVVGAGGDYPTVEELLKDGLHLAGASPVHLAVRGTAGADTAAQREDAIRFWLQLKATDPIPPADYLEALFTATLDTLSPAYRETAKSNFLAIARGGLSEEYLFLTCFADYAVTSYLLGAGTTPGTVTVAYDNRDEAASYELYRREHEAGTFGTDALQTRGEYEASLQETVVAAEEALAAELGGQERIVFLAPMGAHNAIAFEAWQAVAHWNVETVDGTVNAVRVGAPEGDPEHTQTLANLTTRITTAAASDAHATTWIANVSGLQAHYRTMGAYGDITPDDGQTTTFTPPLVTFAFPGWRL